MKNLNRHEWKPATKLNHPERVSPPDHNPSLLAPIYQSVKFVVAEEASPYLYSRVSNPTLKQLEKNLAELQNKEDCIVTASGIAAVTGALLGLVKSGDHVITFREIYRPSRVFIRDILTRFGVETTILKLSEIDKLESAIRAQKTKIIHFESPTNPNLQIADIEKIIQIARKHQVLVSMDGTFAGLHQHTEFDIDIMIQSLTKFGNGHGDVLAGSIAGKASLIQQIRQMTIMLGATLDPHAANLISRGLRTYVLRYDKQTKNSQKIAEYLASHPKITKVYYPGLKTDPGHELARKQMKDMGGVVSFSIDPSVATATKFCHSLKLIQFAVSLGSTETIICPSQMYFGDDLSQDEKKEMGIGDYSLRLSVGIEEAEDIIADLEEALV